MIVSESTKTRAFIGRLETGQDVVGSMRELSVRRRIETGYFSGFGYVRNPVIRVFRPEHRRYLKASETLEGDYLATQVNGTVSFHKDERELNVTGVLVEVESREVVVGEILEAEVVSFEFNVQTYDDVRLFRDDDAATGLRQWVMMELLDQPKSKKKSTASKSVDEIAEVTPEGTEEIEVNVGDFLEHPRLGTCEVVDLTDDSRIAIKIQTGRIVELHRGIVKLDRIESREGHQVYSVAIRRKS